MKPWLPFAELSRLTGQVVQGSPTKTCAGWRRHCFTAASGARNLAGDWDFPGCDESEFADKYQAAVDDDSANLAKSFGC